MASGLQLNRRPGGNNHPIPSKQFILDRLAKVGEDHASSLHRAYNDALDDLAKKRHRKFFYHHPTYASFRVRISELVGEGLIEYSGREEQSDAPQFAHMEDIPMRRYFRLVR